MPPPTAPLCFIVIPFDRFPCTFHHRRNNLNKTGVNHEAQYQPFAASEITVTHTIFTLSDLNKNWVFYCVEMKLGIKMALECLCSVLSSFVGRSDVCYWKMCVWSTPCRPLLLADQWSCRDSTRAVWFLPVEAGPPCPVEFVKHSSLTWFLFVYISKCSPSVCLSSSHTNTILFDLSLFIFAIYMLYFR